MIAKFDIVENKASDHRPIQAKERIERRKKEELTED